MNYEWNYEAPTAEEKEQGRILGREVGVHPVLGQLLVRRGITSAAEARRFFRPQLSELADPFLMNDMHTAVDRLNEAMGRKERIMVYGDYDVDGCTAVALVYRFLRQFYSNVDFYIPDRYDEGYGVSRKGVDHAAEMGVGLVIVLDCGIKAVDEIAYARSLGIDFIICDHHVPDETMPPAVAILNPKRPDNHYPCTELSGCGVGFKFMQAFAESNGIELNKLTPLLDLCAVSIAADIVPITGENRILAYHGLRCLNTAPSIGLQAIVETCGLDERELTMADIIFKIGPRINASGRMQNGSEAVELLVEKDYDAALERAARINLYNEARKDLDKQITEEATELFYRPSVVLTCTGGIATGSARSVTGFDVYKAVQSCADLLENFGGHTYAAGLSMKVENVPEFTRRFEEFVATHIHGEQTRPRLDIDAVIDFKDVTPRFNSELKRFAPFGPGNPKPVFCTKGVYDYGTSKVVGRGQEHIKLELVDNKSSHVMNGIAFGQSAQARYIKTKRAFDICYTIEDNTHKRGDIQLLIEDIRPVEH